MREYNLHESSYFKWLKLVASIPERWKFIIKEEYENTTNLTIHDQHFQHLIKGSRVIAYKNYIYKLTSIKMYSILISKLKINLPLIFI